MVMFFGFCNAPLTFQTFMNHVKDASLTQTYSFLPASWAGNTHKETDFLPIGDREAKERQLLVRRTDSLETIQVLVAKYL